ncbi:casein kinase substrate phosphoprotein PP28-domain-containing protein [Lactarius akahatsu]|uniref:Casein kinase substrate phosphoprotein PP28-domain-containing protein n=1 Tax=Lactarius akahatsu TaxID=416441 RepID=A0AAD4L6C9_9AGAM|nr:casein kinase substrate phosphoprotein PP28-domain-containing protein [Lactarius akahatsu]
MVRGSGKFKTKRGGGRSFSRNMTLDADGTAVGEPRRLSRRALEEAEAKDDDDDDDDDEEEEDSEEESSDEEGGDGGPSSVPDGPELSRAERRELKKKQAEQAAAKIAEEEGEDDLTANPNRLTKKLNISDLSTPRELTRREREQKEKQEAKDRYWKLHLEGKTDQAKADLSRLARIREEREAAAAKRKAEAEERAKALEAAKAARAKR